MRVDVVKMPERVVAQVHQEQTVCHPFSHRAPPGELVLSGGVDLQTVGRRVCHIEDELDFERSLARLVGFEVLDEAIPEAHDSGVDGEDTVEGPHGRLWQTSEMKSVELSQQGEHGGIEAFMKSFTGVIGAGGALINSCQAGQGALSASAEAEDQGPDEEDRLEGGSLSFDDAERVCHALDDAIRQRELEFVEHLSRIVASHGFPGLRAT